VYAVADLMPGRGVPAAGPGHRAATRAGAQPSPGRSSPAYGPAAGLRLDSGRAPAVS